MCDEQDEEDVPVLVKFLGFPIGHAGGLYLYMGFGVIQGWRISTRMDCDR